MVSAGVRAGLFIALLALLRRWLRGRIPARVMVLLWMAAAVRLLIPAAVSVPVNIALPVSVPAPLSDISTGSLSGDAAESMSSGTAGSQSGRSAVRKWLELLLTVADSNYGKAAESEESENNAATQWQDAVSTSTNKTAAATALLVIRLAGLLFCVWLVRRSGRQEREILREALPLTQPQLKELLAYIEAAKPRNLSLKDFGFGPDGQPRLRFLLSDRLRTPVCTGFLRPRVILARIPGTGHDRQLMYILLHEATHARRRDNLLKLIAYGAAALHWFNPFAWILVRLLSRDIELSCDEAVLARTGSDCRRDYASSILDLADGFRRPVYLQSAYSHEHVKERIEAVMKYRKRNAAALCSSALLLTAAAVMFVSAAGTAPADSKAVVEIITEGDMASEIAVQAGSAADATADASLSADVTADEGAATDGAAKSETSAGTSESGTSEAGEATADEQATWVTCRTCRADGTEVLMRTRELDENGFVTASKVRSPQGIPAGMDAVYELDSAGKRLSGICYLEDGTEAGLTTTYTYDTEGNLTKVVWKSEDGAYNYIDTYEYDDHGHIALETRTDADGEVITEDVYENVYDTQDQLALSTITDKVNGGTSTVGYEYDGAGRLVRETWYDEDGNVTEYNEYDY